MIDAALSGIIREPCPWKGVIPARAPNEVLKYVVCPWRGHSLGNGAVLHMFDVVSSITDLGFGGVKEFFSPFPKVFYAIAVCLIIIVSCHNHTYVELLFTLQTLHSTLTLYVIASALVVCLEHV